MSLSIKVLTRASLLAASMIPITVAHAQKSFVALTGSIYRYNGDTIWMEKDSTVMRSIAHGDTIENRTTVNDRVTRDMVAVVHGDSARVISTLGRDGLPRPATGRARSMPASGVTFLQKTLEVEQRTASLGAGRIFDQFMPPALPDPAREYVVSPASRIVQHRDTVWSIKGCPTEQNDTTTFLLFGTDSTRRLTTPERTFGQGMVQSLIGEMRQSLMRDLVAAQLPAPPADLPKGPAMCGSR